MDLGQHKEISQSSSRKSKGNQKNNEANEVITSSGIFNSDGKGKVENGSGKGFDSGGGTGDGKVGSGNSESVDGVCDVVDSLEETVGVNVLVGAGGHSVGIAGLSTG